MELPDARAARVEPGFPGRARQDDRHPIVELGDRLVRRRRHDREGAPDGAVGRITPAGPQAGEDERLAIAAEDAVGLPDPGLAPPLIERVDRDETASPAKGTPECRREGNGLGSRIEGSAGDTRVLRPVGDEAPAIADDRAPRGVLDDHGCLVRGGDVEVAAVVRGKVLGVEDLRQLGGGTLLGESAAHDDQRPVAGESASIGRSLGRVESAR